MPKFGFGKSLHIRHNEQFRQIFRNGKKLGSPFGPLFFYKNSLTHPRLGLSISKKQIQKANMRNQLKRISRESFRLNQYQLPGVDIVMVFYKPVLNLNKKQFREFIDQQWLRLDASYKKR